MEPAPAEDGDGVEWRHATAADRPAPIRRDVPYVEAVLEYRGLDASRFGGAFFPAAVPYACGGERRVFYWDGVLDATTPPAADWTHVCATPYGVHATTDDEAFSPTLTDDDGRTVVVEGTVGGDSTETTLAEPVAPTVAVDAVEAGAVTITVDGDAREVERGDRAELPFGDRTVRLADGTRADAAPTLVVRYPGERAFYHPAVDATYALFPSFGLDLEDAPRALEVTPGPNVDQDAVADALGVELDERPYPERVLWQAFVHRAFGDDAPPALAQFEDGLLAVWSGD